MAAIGGTVDVLALAKDAFHLYHIYRDSQARYRGLCDDIVGLEATLKVLGNKLLLHGSSDADLDSKENASGSGRDENGLSPDEAAALQWLIGQVEKLLAELHARVPSAKVPRGLHRFKWSDSEVEAIRSRITALNSSVAAFSSSLALSQVSFAARTEHAQQEILRTLQVVLDAVQKGNATQAPSPAITLVAEDAVSGAASLDDAFSKDLIEGMKKHSLSDEEIDNDTELATALPKRGAKLASGHTFRHSWSSGPDDDGHATYEVLSAVYGPRVVTNRLQRMIDNQAATGDGVVRFIVDNETMGGDSMYGQHKGLAMVWRKSVLRRNRVVYSQLQRLLAQEGESVTLRLDAALPHADERDAEGMEGLPEGATQIILASWFDADVTDRVATLVANGQTRISAISEDLRTPDPCPHYIKSLSVCWRYVHGPDADASARAAFQTATVLEGQLLEVPPCLRILCARKGDLDITNLLQAMVSGTQTLTLDAQSIQPSQADTRPGDWKVLSIVYRYGTRSPQLLVLPEYADRFELTPHTTSSGNDAQRGAVYDFAASNGIAMANSGSNEAATVVAVVWGLELLSLETASLREAMENGHMSCTNEFFGVDGWEGFVKTCQVFVQNGKELECFTAWEGSDLNVLVL